MGAGALLVYLAATDYSCRLGEVSMSRTHLRLVEEGLIELSEPYGPQLPETSVKVRGDWLPGRVDARLKRFGLTSGV